MSKPLLALALTGFLTSCTFQPGDWRQMRITIDTAALKAGPSDDPTALTDLKCLGINVVGPGIRSFDTEEVTPNFEAILNGSKCSYPGVSSALQSLEDSSFSIVVQAGDKRVFQAFGIETTLECKELPPLPQLLLRARLGKLPDGVTGVYEVGRAVIGQLRTDQAVEIKSSFDASNLKDFADCGEGENPGGLDLTNEIMGLHPGASRTFLVSEGSGTYSCSVSGGSVNGTCSVTAGIGTFTAPAVFSSHYTEVEFTVDDGEGKTGTGHATLFDANLIGAGNEALVWMRGDVDLVSTFWNNQISSSVLTALTASGYNKFTATELRSLQVMSSIPSSGHFFSNFNPSSDWSGAAIYLVVKRLGGECIFCVSPTTLNCKTGQDFFAIKSSTDSVYTLALSLGGTGFNLTNTHASSEFHIQEGYWSSTIPRVIQYMVGNRRETFESFTNASKLPTSGKVAGFALGELQIGGAEMKAYIAEVLYFPTAIPLPLRRQVLNYLNAKYGLPRVDLTP